MMLGCNLDLSIFDQLLQIALMVPKLGRLRHLLIESIPNCQKVGV